MLSSHQAIRSMAAGLCWAATTAAAAQGLQWTGEAGIAHRRLVEYNAAGRSIVTETGPMASAKLGAALGLEGGGRLQGELALAGGRLDYDGMTQAGAFLASRTAHRDAGFTAFWQPWPAAEWGEAALGVRWLQQRRFIASTPAASGLRETSTLLMAGLRWLGPSWPMGRDTSNWRVQLEVQGWISARHRLEVDYLGAFEASSFRAGQRRELVVAGHLSTPGSPWTWTLQWAAVRQDASGLNTLRRNGAAVGTVQHPRLTIGDLSLRVSRSF
jgi:hypothetical protein